MILNKCGTLSHVQNILFISSECPFHTRGCGNNISSIHHYSIFYDYKGQYVNQKWKFQRIKNNKKFCNHMPSQLISFYLLISLEGMSTLIRSQGHQIRTFFFCSVSVLDFALAFSLFLSSRALLSSALSKRFFCNLILFVWSIVRRNSFQRAFYRKEF